MRPHVKMSLNRTARGFSTELCAFLDNPKNHIRTQVFFISQTAVIKTRDFQL